MPGTNFSEIYDNFMMKQTDYRLILLFNTSTTDFETYLQAFLLDAITDFEDVCNQSLVNSNASFTETLTQKNIKVLSLLMTKYWLKKNIDDIRQMNLHLVDKDFKVYSESQNIREKQAKYNALREELSQELVDYSLKDTTMWSSWITDGVFYEP